LAERREVGTTDWSAYLERFHTEKPGITEHVLSRCRSGAVDPYQWCAQPLGHRREPVLDIACGSGPLAAYLSEWIGSDCSTAELAAAGAAGRGPLLRSDATQLPVAGSATDAVVCSMAMQVIQPMMAAIAEVARVLRPGGQAVLLLPAAGPLSWRDALVYLRLQAALRRRIRYPNDRALDPRRFAVVAASCGLVVAGDERRTFSLPVESDADVDEFVRSLYLPDIHPRSRRRARRVLTCRVGSELAVPLRRVVLDRH
jgi:SAM-dependent methyltransferase